MVSGRRKGILEKNNIQGKDLIDLIEHKFKQLEEKLHNSLNDRVKKVTSNKPINKEPRRETFASVIKENHAPDFRYFRYTRYFRMIL